MRSSTHSPFANPMQNSLLSGPVFGEPVSVSEAGRISGQRAQVEAIMADGFWRTLPALQRELRRRFSTIYAETSISARLRGLRGAGYTVTARRTRPDSSLYEYRAERAPHDPRPLTAREQRIVAKHLEQSYAGERAGLPSTADLDAVAGEQRIAEATGGAQ